MGRPKGSKNKSKTVESGESDKSAKSVEEVFQTGVDAREAVEGRADSEPAVATGFELLVFEVIPDIENPTPISASRNDEKPIVLLKSTRAIEVEIRREDKPSLQDELVEQLEQSDSLKCDIDEIKSQRKVVTTRIATLQRQLVTLRRIIDVDCETRLEGLEAVVVRLDTGAEIERRAARPEELQTTIPVAVSDTETSNPTPGPVSPPPPMPAIGYFARNKSAEDYWLTPAQADMLRPLLAEGESMPSRLKDGYLGQMIRAQVLDVDADDSLFLTGEQRNVMIVWVDDESTPLAEVTKLAAHQGDEEGEVLG